MSDEVLDSPPGPEGNDTVNDPDDVEKVAGEHELEDADDHPEGEDDDDDD